MSHLYTDIAVGLVPPIEDTEALRRWLQDVADALNRPPVFKTEFQRLTKSTTINPDRTVIYLCEGGITVTLPHPAKVRAMNFYVKNIDTTEDVFVVPENGTIDNETAFTLAYDECIQIVSDDENYWII